LASPDPKIRYKAIWNSKNDIDENIVCDICLDDDVDEGEDDIVICDMCNSAVHQTCYGKDIKDAFPTSE
jgi:hypothetical protein